MTLKTAVFADDVAGALCVPGNLLESGRSDGFLERVLRSRVSRIGARSCSGQNRLARHRIIQETTEVGVNDEESGRIGRLSR